MKEIDYISIGEQVRTFRRQKGWTQEELAEASDVEPSNISHIERAATKVSLPTLLHIANALEVTLDELVFGSLAKSQNMYRLKSLMNCCGIARRTNCRRLRKS